MIISRRGKLTDGLFTMGFYLRYHTGRVGLARGGWTKYGSCDVRLTATKSPAIGEHRIDSSPPRTHKETAACSESDGVLKGVRPKPDKQIDHILDMGRNIHF